MYLDIYIDEFGDIQGRKSKEVFGIGYFAIRSTVTGAFVKELKENGLERIHLREVKPHEKLRVITLFSQIARKYPCFGGAYIQTNPYSAIEVIKKELIQGLSKDGFRQISIIGHPHHKILNRVLDDSRFYEAYTATLRIPFLHISKSSLKNRSKFARIHVGVTGDIHNYHKKMEVIAPGILSEAKQSHDKFYKLGLIGTYQNIKVDFDLTYSNPMLGAADIFANIGRYKVVDVKKHEDCIKILAPILDKVKMNTFMVV